MMDSDEVYHRIIEEEDVLILTSYRWLRISILLLSILLTATRTRTRMLEDGDMAWNIEHKRMKGGCCSYHFDDG